MYLRFVTERRTEHGRRREGFFQATYSAWRSPETPAFAAKELRRLLDWFDANLETPERLSRSRHKRGKDAGAKTALSWFTPEAKVHIAKAYEAAAILGDFGYVVTVLKTERPGFVVVQDRWQIVAEPFADTPT
jgi:hypothetical protein